MEHTVPSFAVSLIIYLHVFLCADTVSGRTTHSMTYLIAADAIKWTQFNS